MKRLSSQNQPDPSLAEFDSKNRSPKDNLVKGLSIRTNKDGSNIYVFCCQIKGKALFLTLGRTEELSITRAREFTEIIRKEAKRGVHPHITFERLQSNPRITLGQLCTIYMERYAKEFIATWKGEQYRMKHLKPLLPLYLDSIKREDIEDLHRNLGKRGHTSANKVISQLHRMFKKAAEWGYLSKEKGNPAHGIKKYKTNARERFLNGDELDLFYEALRSEPEMWRDFFALCLFTCARKSRVLSMKWAELSLPLCMWTFKNKNGEIQKTPLNSAAMEILKRRYSTKASEWVFPNAQNTGPLKDPTKSINRIRDRLSSLDHFTIHDVRRSGLSQMAINGESILVIAQMAGHKDIRSTAIYARLNMDPVRQAAEKMAKSLGKFSNYSKKNDVTLSMVPAEIMSNSEGSCQDAKFRAQRKALVTPCQQVLIEAKIIGCLQFGHRTKKAMYQRLGSQFPMDSIELERILGEMIERKLVYRYREEPNWQYWRYAVVKEAVEA